MSATTVALVGAVGGAGTTRTAVETATTLARDGQEVAILDAAYATQGLADYLSGRLDPDVTALVTDETDRDLDAGLVDLDAAVPCRVACAPAWAPFERLARAKTPEAVRALERWAEEAAPEFDHDLLDVPPVAVNQAVAAVAFPEPKRMEGRELGGLEQKRPPEPANDDVLVGAVDVADGRPCLPGVGDHQQHQLLLLYC